MEGKRLSAPAIRARKGETAALVCLTAYTAPMAAALDEIDFSGWAAVELAFRAEHPVTRPMGDNYRMSLQFLRRLFGQGD